MTINVITGIKNLDLLQLTIKILDILFWVNKKFKRQGEKIAVKDFNNEAINNQVDLKPHMAEWARFSKIQVRNQQEVTHSNIFNLCSYQWILTPHTKAIMI